MAVAALIAGGLGAAGSIGSSLINSNAASSASQQQVAAQQAALAQQQSLYSQGLGTAQSALNPYVQAGQSVLPTLQSLLTPGASQTATLSQLPGFQFQSQYGTMATTNALAARGLGGSTGALAEGISNYNQGLASTSYNNLVSQLQGFANTGASSAGTLGTAALGGAINSGNAQASTLGNIGNAQASGTLGSAGALGNGLTSATGSATNSLLLGQVLQNNANGGSGLYGPSQIANIGNMNALSASDAQANAYGQAMGLN